MSAVSPPPAHPRAALLSLSAAYFVFGTGSLAVIGLIEPMALQWRVSRSAVAQLVTVFALAFALLAPAVQVAAARRGQRQLIVAGLLVLALGLLGTALAPDLGTAIAGRVLTALGAAAVGPVASSLAASLVPPRRQAQALATVFAGMSTATVVGVPLAAWLGQVLSWQGVFVVLAAAAALCAAAVRSWVPDAPAAAAVRAGDLLEALQRPASGWAFGATLAQMAAQFATYGLVALLLRQRFGATPAQVSTALLVFGLGGVAANALVGRLGDRLPAPAWIATSLAGLAAVFVALLVGGDALALAFVLLGAWALLGTLFMVPQQKRLIALAPTQRGLLLAVNASALYLGMSLGTAVGAAAQGLLGLGVLPLASLALVGLAAASHARSVRSLAREQAAGRQPPEALPARH